MTILEFLDRWLERRAQNQRPPRDIRQFIGFAFLAGYYAMVWRFSINAIPGENKDLIRDAMLTLGPPVGLIVGAMFRSDAKEDRATENTARAFSAIEAAAKSSGAGAIQDGDQVTVRKETGDGMG